MFYKSFTFGNEKSILQSKNHVFNENCTLAWNDILLRSGLKRVSIYFAFCHPHMFDYLVHQKIGFNDQYRDDLYCDFFVCSVCFAFRILHMLV